MIEVHPPMVLDGPDQTDLLASRLAPRLRAGDVILLDGPIGAGKTHLARAIIHALGVDEDVPSPTYTLIQAYDGPGAEIWHADLYRLTDAEEVVELGLTEAFDTALCFVEWPDRLGSYRPEKALALQFSMASDGRVLRFFSADPDWIDRLSNV